jgi:predicted nucleic acid-binding protein
VDRVFLDANILFSSAYRPDAGLRKLWGIPDIELVTSAYAAEEARRNLDLPEQRAALDALLLSVQVLAATPGDSPLTRPLDLAEKDRPILAMAVATRATHLLTGDVRHFGRYYSQTVAGVLILPPAVYLRTHGREEGSA